MSAAHAVREGEIVLIGRFGGAADYPAEPVRFTIGTPLEHALRTVPELLQPAPVPSQPQHARSENASVAPAAYNAVPTATDLAQRGSDAAETHVFGVRGKGRRFVYVFDRSSSMEGAPLAAAKR